MKRMQIILLVLTLTVLLCTCSKGDVYSAQQVVGPSSVYTEQEIRSAMQPVKRYFAREFNGCTLLFLTYNEEKTLESAKAWAENYGADEAIVLLSDFYVDSRGGDGSLNPNSTYKNYQWILTRSGSEKWQLRTWGYG